MLLPILAPHFMAVLVSRQTKRGKIKNDLKYIFMKKKYFLTIIKKAKILICYIIQKQKSIKEF